MRPFLACRGITKRYGSIVANDRVDFDVSPGEVHALVGENGAGKSTLVACAYGLLQPDEGEIQVEGRPVRIRHPSDALALGIGLVQQHFVLVPPLTVTENIVLGAEPQRGVAFRRQESERNVADLCAKFSLDLDPREKVERLSVAERQRVEIAKALYRRARLLILDEPTAVLTPQESRSLLANLAALRSQGLAIILITHRVPEALSIADRVTVLRRGRVVLHEKAACLSTGQLAEAIVGEHKPTEIHSCTSPGEPLVVVSNLTSKPGARGLRLNNISFALRRGEILGIAGVSGNGQQELVDALLGLLPINQGSYMVGERNLARATTREIRQAGVACILQDRRSQCLLLSSSVTENLYLGHRRASERWGLVSPRDRAKEAQRRIEEFEIAAPGPDTPVAALSGGHQQRVVAAREMAGQPRFIIAHDPTRGLDIRAAGRLRSLLLQACESGAVVLLISSDLDEIISLANRVAVLYDGCIRGTFATRSITAEDLGRAMTGMEVKTDVGPPQAGSLCHPC
jgi:simple sugar transport system ATP-binding protein